MSNNCLEQITKREFYANLYEQKKEFLSMRIEKNDLNRIFSEYKQMETDILTYKSMGYNIRYLISKEKELSFEYYYNPIGF